MKTGSDADAPAVDLQATTATTMADLSALPAPASYPGSNRVAPTETTVFSVSARLTGFKLEDDGDIHLILTDPAAATMISEIPDAACVASTSPFLTAIGQARAYFTSRYTPSTSSFTTVNVAVKVRGVGFFDVLHGQDGVAPNGIELHPALSIFFGPAARHHLGPRGRRHPVRHLRGDLPHQLRPRRPRGVRRHRGSLPRRADRRCRSSQARWAGAAVPTRVRGSRRDR